MQADLLSPEVAASPDYGQALLTVADCGDWARSAVKSLSMRVVIFDGPATDPSRAEWEGAG